MPITQILQFCHMPSELTRFLCQSIAPGYRFHQAFPKSSSLISVKPFEARHMPVQQDLMVRQLVLKRFFQLNRALTALLKLQRDLFEVLKNQGMLLGGAILAHGLEYDVLELLRATGFLGIRDLSSDRQLSTDISIIARRLTKTAFQGKSRGFGSGSGVRVKQVAGLR